jgi:hypothetical protein
MALARECFPRERAPPSNENKMSDGGGGRALLAVEVWKSSQEVERTAVRRSLHRMVRCQSPRQQAFGAP